MEAIGDDVFPSACVGGEDGALAGHGFGDGEAEAFVPREGGDEGHALEKSGEFGAGAFAVEDDALAEACVVDLALKLVLIVAEFGSGFSDDDDGGGGVFFEEGDGGIDEEVDAFLRADTAEDADAVFAGEAEFLPSLFFVGGDLEAVEVDAVRDHDVGFVFEVGLGCGAGSEDAVHLGHEPTGELRMVALGGGGEDDLELCSEFASGEGLDHFVISTSVEEAGFVVEFDEVAEAEDRGVFGEVVFSENGEGHAGLDLGKGLEHGRGDAGEAFVRVAKNEVRDGHLVEFGGVVRAICEAKSDGADEEEVAGEELEVGFDSGGDIGVEVVTKRGSPKEGGAEKAGENEDEHEGGGEESGRRVRGEFAKELAKVLAVLFEF